MVCSLLRWKVTTNFFLMNISNCELFSNYSISSISQLPCASWDYRWSCSSQFFASFQLFFQYHCVTFSFTSHDQQCNFSNISYLGMCAYQPCLTTSNKYVFNKQYVINNHVHLTQQYVRMCYVFIMCMQATFCKHLWSILYVAIN